MADRGYFSRCVAECTGTSLRSWRGRPADALSTEFQRAYSTVEAMMLTRRSGLPTVIP